MAKVTRTKGSHYWSYVPQPLFLEPVESPLPAPPKSPKIKAETPTKVTKKDLPPLQETIEAGFCNLCTKNYHRKGLMIKLDNGTFVHRQCLLKVMNGDLDTKDES